MWRSPHKSQIIEVMTAEFMPTQLVLFHVKHAVVSVCRKGFKKLQEWLLQGLLTLLCTYLSLFLFYTTHTDTLINTENRKISLAGQRVAATAEDRFRFRPVDCSKTWASAPEEWASNRKKISSVITPSSLNAPSTTDLFVQLYNSGLF